MNRKIPFILFFAFALQIGLWAYLWATTEFVLVFDSEGYEHLGKLLSQQGWLEFFKTGPHREPLYPFLVAISMRLADTIGVSYHPMIKLFGLIILGLSQLLLLKLFDAAQVRRAISWPFILYFGLSPYVIHSALSLYSEIAAYPFFIAIPLLTAVLWRRIKEGVEVRALTWTAFGLGACLLTVAFAKGLMEMLTPLYLIIVFATGIRISSLPLLPSLKKYVPLFLVILLTFYVPLISYKGLNAKHNGHFTLSDRASFILYGNIVRRSMVPLTAQSVAAHALTVPGAGLCEKVLPLKDCAAWGFSVSDRIFGQRLAQLSAEGTSGNDQNKILLNESAGAFFKTPLRQAVHLVIEGAKMFFWDTTWGAFVAYPDWFEKLLFWPPLKLGVIFGAAIIALGGTLGAAASLVASLRNSSSQFPFELLSSAVVVLLFVASFSFFYIQRRYALPIAPLFLFMAGHCADRIFRKKNVRLIA